jgi:aminobenzoyl-glutamate utilization protein B
MNVGTNYLREHVPPDTRIHYVTTSGGKEPNVVPSFAEVWYYVRAPRREDVENVYRRITQIAEGACLMTGATLEIKFQTGLYDYLPNPVLTGLLDESLQEVGPHPFTETEKEFARMIDESFSPGQKRAVFQLYHIPSELLGVTLHEDVAPDLIRGERLWGSTDVGDVSWIVPTGQMMTACYVLGTMPHSWQAVAAAGSSIGYKGMITAARALALAGYQLLTRPERLAQARQAFIKAKENQSYRSPLPPDLKPPLAK